MALKSFRELEVWQVAMSLARDVYGVLGRLPSEERFALSDQMRRSAISVVSNIAEGFGRESTKDFVHFLAMSRGSLFELETQLELAESVGYVDISDTLKDEIDHVGRMLNVLSAKLKSRLSAGHEPRATSHEPRTTSHEPRATSHEPRATGHGPRTTSNEPRQ